MEKFINKKEIIFWPFLIAPFVYIAYMWNVLPDRIPTHFDLNGVPNGWSGKNGVFILPIVGVFTYVTLLSIPLIDPKKMSMEFFFSNFYMIRLIVAIFLCATSFLPITAAMNHPLHYGPGWMMAALFIFFGLMGNFIINIKPNWFAGIRTPWTLSSDTVWKKTHLVVGRIWFYGGFLGAMLTFFVPQSWGGKLLGLFVLASVLFAYIYSFWLFKKEEVKQQ